MLILLFTGKTIHKGLGFDGKDTGTLCLPNSKKFLCEKYKHLKLIVVDEISMVSNVMLLRMNVRINAIRGALPNSVLGHDIHCLFVGDLFQLKPVMDGYIFNDLKLETSKMIQNKNKDIPYAALSKNIWKDHIKMYELEEIMRQKDDEPWAMALNRFREGTQTEADYVMIEERMYDPTENYPFDKPHLFYTNDEVNQFNRKVYDKMESDTKVQVKSNTYVVSDVSKPVKDKILRSLETVPIYKNHKKTGGLVDALDLCEGLQYDFTYNLDADDGITNGTSCTLRKIEYRDQHRKPSILWVEFDEPQIGARYRSEYSHLYSNQIPRNLTPTVVMNQTFEVLKKTVNRQQFPIVGSAARTFHACQGKSLQSAAMAMPTKNIPGIVYTGLSRVTKVENLALLRFDRSKVCVSDEVKDEMKRLRGEDFQYKISFKHFMEEKDKNDFTTRVLFHNVNSLHCHFDDVKAEPNYLNADIIGLAESRLSLSDDDKTYSLEDYGFQKVIRNDQEPPRLPAQTRPYHGLAIYLKSEFAIMESHHHQSDSIEYSLLSVVNKHVPHRIMQFAFVYKANGCSNKLLYDTMLKLKSQTKEVFPLSVIGDFNTDPERSPAVVTKVENILCCPQLQSEYSYIPNDDVKSTIDLVFSNADQPIVGVIESLFSNHRVVTLSC